MLLRRGPITDFYFSLFFEFYARSKYELHTILYVLFVILLLITDLNNICQGVKISKALLVLESILDLFLQIAISLGIAECHSTYEMFYYSCLSGYEGHNESSSSSSSNNNNNNNNAHTSSSFAQFIPKEELLRHLTNTSDLFQQYIPMSIPSLNSHGPAATLPLSPSDIPSHSTSTSTSTSTSSIPDAFLKESCYLPMSAFLGSIASTCHYIKSLSNIIEADTTDTRVKTTKTLFSIYQSVALVSKEETILQNNVDYSLSLSIFHMKKDPVFYKNHVIASRQTQLKKDYYKNYKSVHQEFPDELESESESESESASVSSSNKSTEVCPIEYEKGSSKLTHSSKINEFSLLNKQKKCIDDSIKPTCNLLGRLLTNLVYPLKSKLERWDFYELDQFKMIVMQHYMKFKLGKFYQKVQISSHEMMRYILFGLRLEILRSLNYFHSTDLCNSKDMSNQLGNECP